MPTASTLLHPGTSGEVRLYHGTNARFARFDMAFAARPGMAGNGNLGVWLASQRQVQLREAEGTDAAREAERTYYANRRNELLAQGYDAIYVRECTGALDMVVGLDVAKISILQQ